MLSARGQETILLVENEPALRELMRRFLEGSGYRVVSAANGDEAIAAGARHSTPIDLLLTDVVMPGMSGFALANRIAELRAETKILYVSGYAGDYEQTIEGQVDSFVPGVGCELVGATKEEQKCETNTSKSLVKQVAGVHCCELFRR